MLFIKLQKTINNKPSLKNFVTNQCYYNAGYQQFKLSAKVTMKKCKERKVLKINHILIACFAKHLSEHCG